MTVRKDHVANGAIIPDAIKPKTLNNDEITAISVDDIPEDGGGGGGAGVGGAASGPAGTTTADLAKSDMARVSARKMEYQVGVER